MNVAVIGGGLAGLSAACRLVRSHPGLAVQVLDMGREAGGRASSRAAGELSFDHGAQTVISNQPRFKQVAAEWVDAGVAAQWLGAGGAVIDAAAGSLLAGAGRGESPFCSPDGQAAVVVGVPTMNAIVQHAAQQIQQGGGSVTTGCRVTAAAWDAQERTWSLEATQYTPAGPQQVQLGSFAALVVADAGPMLPGQLEWRSASPMLAAAAERVQSLSFSPCYALMVAFDQPLGAPFSAASIRNSASFRWTANNSSKPGRPGGPQCWTVLTTGSYARQLMADYGKGTQTPEYREAVARQLLQEWRQVMQPFCSQAALAAEPVYLSSQRWGRAFVEQGLGQDCLALQGDRLAICGDWVPAGASTIENAWLSGESAADAVVAMLA